MDGGAPLYFIMGTDAWLEIQKEEEIISLVARNYHKTYFSCSIDNETFEKIKFYEECGIIVITCSKRISGKRFDRKFKC
ncbi:hypothetical protein [Flavobacterium ginsengiterrae]|uniref:Uncharacterized protein n=1 Tax=Flavobacterium ginsengiterrae TaxID=871695 RepID=A0ABP7GC29_9FLAO